MVRRGYATGLSVDAALSFAALGGSRGVLLGRQPHLCGRKFTGRHYVFADNDASLTGERSAWKTGLPYAMSDEFGQDANDLHQAAGVMAVAKKVMEARSR